VKTTPTATALHTAVKVKDHTLVPTWDRHYIPVQAHRISIAREILVAVIAAPASILALIHLGAHVCKTWSAGGSWPES